MQLSSLVQQVDPPEFIINVAYVKGNGDPDVETIVKFYEQKGLKFKMTPYDPKDQRRGVIRNLQVKNSTEDWLLFVDADSVYHPNCFNGLTKHMDPELQNVIGCTRFKVTDTEKTNQYFDNLESMYIESAYNVAESLDIISQSRMRAGAHGGFQLVTKKTIMEKTGGIYVKKISADDPMGEGQYRSDIKFRYSIDGGVGQSKMIEIKPLQITLSHYRKKHDKQFDINAQN